MAELHEKQLHYLLKKVKQHEETIAQLLVMTAKTNRLLAEASSNVKTYTKEKLITN